MRFTAATVLGLAAVAFAQDAASPAAPDAATQGADAEADDLAPADLSKSWNHGDFDFAPGAGMPEFQIDMPNAAPPSDLTVGPSKKPIWHPAHPGIFIDDCDDDKADKWHWAHKGIKHPKPIIPHHKWDKSTVTATKTKTVFDCGPHVPSCPGKPKTKYTTTTVVVTTTICPIPIKENPPPPSKPSAPAPPPPPVAPPKPTSPAPAKPPPAVTPGPVVPNVPAVSKPPVVISAGGAAQNAAGALAAVAAFVAALI